MTRAIPFLILGLIIGVGGSYAYFAGGVRDWFTETPDEGQVEDEYDSKPREVSALGRVQPASGVISVMGPPGDRISSIEVKVGEAVTTETTIIELASSELTELQLKIAQTRVAEADKRIEEETDVAQQAINAANLQIDSIDEKAKDRDVLVKKVDLTRKNFEQAESELEVLVNISDKLVSETKKSRQRLLVEKAELELKVAEAELAQFDRGIENARKAANSELEAAKAALDVVPAAVPRNSLKAAEDLAAYQNTQAVIKSPIDGEVLNIMGKEGQAIGPQPLMQIANLSKMEVVAEVFESDLKHVKLGQRVEIESRAFQMPFTKEHIFGRVSKIGQVISTPALQTLDPFAQADRRVAEVHILITPKDNPTPGAIEEAARLINLQVEVKFRLNDADAYDVDPDWNKGVEDSQ